MPNHVANFVIITGEPVDVKNFWKEATTSKNPDNNGTFCYSNIYPIPDGVNWYDWCIKYWGNKWGCYDVDSDVSQIDNGIVSMTYDTAWSYSNPFWIWVTQKFKIKVKKYFHDEGSWFCGKEKYCNGLVKSSVIYQSYKTQKHYFIKYANICGRPDYYQHNENDDMTTT
ncbi:hypothetical protein QJ857_gp0629 [Tupanvirus soda lake]|uniref:YubB ferredoxin-like domain-containing protein n=2 Tax=Tupanvirus TaxID=2094720 RepID=A0A6N1NLI2_9VIRU|nr:hypothetical protein QJ857_gp0629 [Tupanvirus soda lake]QKU35414.1 hypothetical protein [Tupanvirus soda lake]